MKKLLEQLDKLNRPWERKVSDLKDLVQVQGSRGNWDYSEYMHGLYNGMELALSIMEEREPIYKDAPGEWLKDRSEKVKPEVSESIKHLYPLLEKALQMDEGWKEQLAAGVIATSLALGTPTAADASNKPRVTNQEADIDLNKLLKAIKQIESSGGVDKRDRYEAGVEKQLRDRFDKLRTSTKEAIKKYGYNKVATSYGPYQIMASTAYDLGFKGSPEELRDEKVSEYWVKELLGDLIQSRKTNNIKDIISAYNAGLGRIGSNPDYVNKVMKYYA